jgi:hypothetical protein
LTRAEKKAAATERELSFLEEEGCGHKKGGEGINRKEEREEEAKFYNAVALILALEEASLLWLA